MTGSLGDTPAVARQRVRRELRKARRATPLTQSDVAKRLGWSLSKVQRIEIGEVAVSETDLRAMLALLGVTAPNTVADLVADARLTRRERWSTAPEHRKYLTPGLRQLIQFEAVATEIRSYQPIMLPGTVQTPELAEYIVDEAGRAQSAEERQVRFDVRLLRSKQVIERADGPKYYLVLDESVLKRNIGGTRIMAEQLEYLTEVADRPNISLRVTPFRNKQGPIAALVGAFILLSLSDDDADDSVVYLERFREDTIDHDPEKIANYRGAFEELWNLSLHEDASRRLVAAEAAACRSRLDQLGDGNTVN